MKQWWQRFIGSERWDAVWLFVATKALAVLAAVPIGLAWKAETGGGRAFLISLGAGVYVVSFILDALAKASERSRKTSAAKAVTQARSDTVTYVCNAFSGIPHHTATFLGLVRSGDPATRSHLHRYFENVMDSLTRAVSAQEPRVCLYLAETAEERNEGDDGAITLILCGNGVGRSDPPRRTFDSTTPYGSELIRRMNDRRPLIVEDTEDPPDDVRDLLDCTDKYYKSFIVVPVTYNEHEYGMLAIDSPEANALSKSNQAIAHLFGRFLGSGFHMQQSSPASLPIGSVPRVSVTPNGEGGGIQ